MIGTVLDKYGDTLSAGTTFVDPTDDGDTIRALVYLEHTVTDGRLDHGARNVVSRRFQFVEVTADGDITDPGAEPYLNYEPADESVRDLLADVDTDWADGGIDETARSWATANLATPHFAEVADITKARLDRTRRAVEERLNSEIRYWDARAAELKQQELHGKKPRLNSGRARQRRRPRSPQDPTPSRTRHRSRPRQPRSHGRRRRARRPPRTHRPTHRADARGDRPRGRQGHRPARRRRRHGRRATLGRPAVEQDHNNPGFDILSEDPATGIVYQIEVKGHRPEHPEIKVRARQVRQAKQNPERFRLAVVRVPTSQSGNQPCATSSALRRLRAALRTDVRATERYALISCHSRSPVVNPARAAPNREAACHQNGAPVTLRR